jgi:hypothetical protein
MNIIELEDIGEYIYCPVTGKPMLSDIDPTEVPSVIGCWVLEAAEDPIIQAEELQKHWDEYYEKLTRTGDDETDSDYPDIDAFLSSIERPNWFAIKYSQKGFACGPVWEYGWIIFDAERGASFMEDNES